MRRLLSSLFLFLPMLSLAQQSWTRVVPEVSTPVQVVAQQDGHYVVLGYKDPEGQNEFNFHIPTLTRYNNQGTQVWQRRYQHAKTAALGPTRLDVMQNGDLWLAGEARTINNRGPRFMVARVDGQTGDTVYVRLPLRDSVEYQTQIHLPPTTIYEIADFYLHPSPQGDSFFKVRMTGGDILAGTLKQFTENYEVLPGQDMNRFVFHFRRQFSNPYFVSRPEGFSLFWNYNFTSLTKFFPDGSFRMKNVSQTGLAAPSAAGGGLVININKVVLLDHNLEKVLERSYSEFAPMEGEELKFLKPAGNAYLVAGYYNLTNAQEKAVFLMKLDAQGNLLWKQYYPAEQGTEVIDLVSGSDGGGVMLWQRQKEVRLVKTTDKGLVLGSKEALGEAVGARLHPNPFNGNDITLTFSRSFSGNVQLLDLTGRIYREEKVRQEKQHVLQTPVALPPGLYFIKIFGADGKSQSLKLIRN